MRKLTMTFTAAALMLGTMAIAANAQTQAPGAAGLNHQAQNATLFKQAACRGFGDGARRDVLTSAPCDGGPPAAFADARFSRSASS